MNKKIIIYIFILIVIAIVVAGVVAWPKPSEEIKQHQVLNFDECVAAGNPVMESYPRQCREGEKTFIEDIGNEQEKTDLIRVNIPRPNQNIQSPLTVLGEARGTWFFEGSLPVVVVDWDGKIIGQGIATAESDWMTEDFVPFGATIKFEVDKNAYSNKGSLILRKDNPSGLPENDDALEIPVVLADNSEFNRACPQDAELCPDGSYVGRVGSNCEFASCP